MPQYSVGQLVSRANAGNIGVRGLRKLLQAGVDPQSLGQSGVQSPLTVDPQADLSARRASLYSTAVQAAHNAAPGTELSAGIQRRLALGAGGPNSATTFAPHSGAEVQNLSGQYPAILEALKRRSTGIQSQAGIYR
jgi:hypothetical protein